MNILHHVQSLDQTEGGLAVAVASLCSALKEKELSDLTLTAAGNFKDSVPLSDKITPALIPTSNSLITHFLPAPSFASNETFDAVHQHGIWSRSMRVMANYATNHGLPLIISPHGMLEPWALRQRALRKQVAWRLYQRDILEQAIAFHATSKLEAEQIRRLGFYQPIAVIPNGVSLDSVPDFPSDTQKTDVQTAVFLSRLHPKKGLETLLKAWAKNPPDNWELQVFGEGDGRYKKKIAQLIVRLKLAGHVKLMGPVYGDAKWKALKDAGLFVLPSFSENFGIVIAEALLAGTPVITTTETPWEVIESEGCGWWAEPTVESIGIALKEATSKTPTELEEMGRAGSKLIESKFRWDLIAEQMQDFYQWVSNDGDRPTFVLT